MLSTLKRWSLGVVLAACGFALGHVGESFYLKAKYPAAYKFENHPNGYAMNRLGDFYQLHEPGWDPDIQRSYIEEKSAMTLGTILALALLAASAIRAGEKS